ncbi:MAG: Mrp/NBP35 family ATP-binding protein [Pseudomonadota bacterium]
MTFHTTADRDAALRALDAVVDPRTGKGLVAAGLVQGLTIRDGRAGFMLEVPAADARRYAPVRDAAEKALAGLAGVSKAQVVLTAAAAPPPARGGRLNRDPRAEPGSQETAERPPNVRRVIAVASGKGGVGKSTVAVNLACALARRGLRVGLADADIYGPSAPTMLGVSGRPEFDGDRLRPFEAHGVRVMSIGFVAEADAPMIFRGPRASGAVRQMTLGVDWASAAEPLDVLVVDLPPGTGDIHLTVLQTVKLDGVVLVSTPQEVALVDARRAATMFRRTGAPILGLIENMAFFPDPATGAPIPIFGAGGGRAEAARLGVPLLAEIPLDIALREAGDAGTPPATGPVAALFDSVAGALAQGRPAGTGLAG